MSLRPTPVSNELHDYVLDHCDAPDDVQRALIERTRELGDDADMQISPDQGALLTFLARLIGATFVVEVGTFTGYSALCLARGLPLGGRLVCCDIDTTWTDIAQEYWQKAGVADRIDLHIGHAADTLAQLPPDPPIDMAFLDADKTGYERYYQLLMERMRPGGLIAVDNTLSAGRVVQSQPRSENVRATQVFNDELMTDERVDVVLLTVADGVTVVRKK